MTESSPARRAAVADRLQVAVGRMLQERVAGSDAAARGEAIWGAPGPRWFGPQDPIWQVQEDASMYPAGVTALLLQSLHPQAMAGVAGHSGYRSDPWGRLQRTADYLTITVFGPIDQGEAIIERVRGIHRRVRGKDHRGRPYRADDPHLLRWVHCAEAWSFLTAHRRYGRMPLAPADYDRYVRQSGEISARLGTSGLPQSVAELEEQLAAFRPELEVTPAALEACRFLLHEPPLPWSARPGYWLIAAGGVALLPAWAREMLDLPAHGVLPTGAGWAGAVGAKAVRWGLDGLRIDRTSGYRASRSSDNG